MKLIIIGLLLFTSCKPFQKNALTFIDQAKLGGNTLEKFQLNKLRRSDSIVYKGKDSFEFCQEYINIKPELKKAYKGKINEFYIDSIDKIFIDYMTAEYYKGELISLQLITKGKKRIDSLYKTIQKITGKKFNFIHWWQHSYYTKACGHIKTKHIVIDCIIYPYDHEAIFLITSPSIKYREIFEKERPFWYKINFEAGDPWD